MSKTVFALLPLLLLLSAGQRIPGGFTPTPLDPSVYEMDETSRGVDLSHAAQGIVAATGENCKLQICYGDIVQTYDLTDQPTLLPLSYGSGVYHFRLMERLGGDRYTEALSLEREILLADELLPFLQPNCMVSYSAASPCVTRAAAIVTGAASDLEAAQRLCAYVHRNIRYDYDRAADLPSGYRPGPDETDRSGRGICADSAALLTAMLRGVGIPARLIYGDADGVYHAWVEAWCQKEWRRFDPVRGRGVATGNYVGEKVY